MASTQPSAASAKPSRSGCSKQNQSSPARRDAATIAVGSAPGASATVSATRHSPWRRARRAPSLRWARSRAARAVRGAGGRRPAATRRAQVSPRPREMAISPVRIISMSPNGRTMRSKASTLSVVPVTSMMIERLRHVDDLAAEDLRDLHDLGALGAVGGDLEQRELAGDGVARLEVADLQDVDQLVQLLGDLVDRVQRAVDGQRDARQPPLVGRADREGVDVEAAPREQARDARQHAGLVLDEDRQDVLAPRPHPAGRLELLEAQQLLGAWLAHDAQPTMSRAAWPGEIIGYTFSSRRDADVDEDRALGGERLLDVRRPACSCRSGACPWRRRRRRA